ncbi:MAG: hypothetical protein Unbinned1327contig1000_5 [Prokaryotic dsDNA virus sp.]|nr:MAG: hypothetical protein Unbinned1327contig1000_5 [Prokaryotic dsDNA virus sp.]|tara:strand:- start:9142 stop:9420 length:279 start_codon:yes stop_codon:yes gene_type:complete
MKIGKKNHECDCGEGDCHDCQPGAVNTPERIAEGRLLSPMDVHEFDKKAMKRRVGKRRRGSRSGKAVPNYNVSGGGPIQGGATSAPPSHGGD